MAEGMGLDASEVLERIHVARAYNSAHQMLLVDEIQRMGRSIDVRLIIVDSLTSHFRAEFLGRGMLAARQQKLNRHLKDLKKLADVNNALVLVTNQVHSKPDAMWGDQQSRSVDTSLGTQAHSACTLGNPRGAVELLA